MVILALLPAVRLAPLAYSHPSPPIFVADNTVVFRVDPSTGALVVLTDLTDLSQGAGPWTEEQIKGGPKGGGWVTHPSLAISAPGELLLYGCATDGCFLFRVNAASGRRSLIYAFHNKTNPFHAMGPIGLSGLAIHPSGDAMILNPFVGSGGNGSLVAVNLSTGANKTISDFGDPSQGPTGTAWAAGIAVDRSGATFVPARVSLPCVCWSVFSVDPISGRRTVLTQFWDAAQGPTQGAGVNGAIAVAVEPSGSVLSSGNTRLIRIDSVGRRTLVSDFEDPSQGPSGILILALAVDAAGQVYVLTTPRVLFGGSLIAVDPSTGTRRKISDFGSLSFPTGIAVAASTLTSTSTASSTSTSVSTVKTTAGTTAPSRPQTTRPIPGYTAEPIALGLALAFVSAALLRKRRLRPRSL